MPNFFVNIVHKTLVNVEEVNEWDIKNIPLVDDYGEPLIDPDEPTGFSFVPDEWHDEMQVLQTAKYYGFTPKYLNEEIGLDEFVRYSMYVKVFSYNHPKKKGQIPPWR